VVDVRHTVGKSQSFSHYQLEERTQSPQEINRERRKTSDNRRIRNLTCTHRGKLRELYDPYHRTLFHRT